MKKLASVILAGALALSLLAVSASADFDGAIKKGTAKVDGVLDEAYNYSFSLKDLGTADNAYGTEWWYSATADVYFLYDDTYLYICAEVEDDDVLTKGEEFATTTDNVHIYQNDNIELRLALDGTTDTIKVGIDAYGYACYGLAANYEKIDYSTFKYATTYTDTSYVVEVAIPCTKGQLDMIEAGKLGFAYQLNDINADGRHVNHTTSFEGEAVKFPVFVALSSEAAVAGSTTPSTPSAPAEETTAPSAPAEETTAPSAPAEETTAPSAPAEETTAPSAPAEETTAPSAPAEGTTTAPNTFDPAIIAVALTAASGAAFVLASKKR